MKTVVQRLLFVFLSSLILVFFSEKTYWYVQGYTWFELALFYFFPIFIFLWVVERFHVHRLAPLFLTAALYGFLVEGVLVPVLYEGEGFGLFAVSYTSLAWHAPLSVIFGWYFIHKWLLQGKFYLLLITSVVFGLFWGTWSLVYWLPENLNDPELIAEGFNLGVWPVEEFGLFSFLMTLGLALSHWLLSWVWKREFSPSIWEIWGVGLLLLAQFIFVIAIPIPIAWVKLPVLLGVVFIGLWANLRRETAVTVIEEFEGRFQLRRTLPLFAMPFAATFIYGAATLIQPSEAFIRDVCYHALVFIQTGLGWLLFLGAIVWSSFFDRRGIH